MQFFGFRLPQPPSWATSSRTDAFDEVRAFVAKADGEHSRVVHGTGPLGYEWHALPGRAVALRWGRTSLAQTIRGAVDAAVLHLPIDSASTYVFGRRRVRVAPGGAMFIAPGWEFTRHCGPGALIAVGFDPAMLAAEVNARHPLAAGAWTPRSQAMTLAHAATAAIEVAIGSLASTGSAASVPPGRDTREARAIATMADLLLQGTKVRDVPPLLPSRLACVEEWIDTHLDEPITLGRLCKVAGVGPRSLQAAFASLRGMSPMRFVAERRLAAARHRLLRAGPDRDAQASPSTSGSRTWGASRRSTARFFGESPSRTLHGRPHQESPAHPAVARDAAPE